MQERKRNRHKKLDKHEEKVLRGQSQILEDIKYRDRQIKPLQAKNERQRDALRQLEKKQMMCLVGASGSGKSQIASWYACKEWLRGSVDNIIITRPNKSMDGDDAAIPGTDFQKVLPYTMAILLKFKYYLGTGTLKNNLRQEMQDVLFNDISGIQVYSLEKLNGFSFDSRTIIICDEAQSSTIGQMKSLVTRCEKGAKLIICGDLLQGAIGPKNGLSFILDRIERNPHEDIGVVKFRAEDCCREGISAHFTEMFEREGMWSDRN